MKCPNRSIIALLKKYLDLRNNVVRDGIIIWIQAKLMANGLFKRIENLWITSLNLEKGGLWSESNYKIKEHSIWLKIVTTLWYLNSKNKIQVKNKSVKPIWLEKSINSFIQRKSKRKVHNSSNRNKSNKNKKNKIKNKKLNYVIRIFQLKLFNN